MKDKKNLLIVSCKVLSSVDTQMEMEYKIPNEHNLRNEATYKEDYKRFGTKQIRILNDIIEKTGCEVMFIDDVEHKDYLKVILKDKGFKHLHKIMSIKQKNDINGIFLNTYNCFFDLTIIATKKLTNINCNNIIIKPGVGLTLNEGIRIISYITDLDYRWEKARGMLNYKTSYQFLNFHKKYCWNF